MTTSTLPARMNAATYDSAAAFMLAPATVERGRALGFADGMQFYFAGRCGVLGDAAPDVVASAHGFLAPGYAATVWPAAGEVCPRAVAVQEFAQACETYGEAALGELPPADAARTAELVAALVDGVPVSGKVLFAGWRALDRPTGPRGRAAHLLQVLREWRGGTHVACLAAHGIGPLEAIMANGGPVYAEIFGWPAPWPEPGEAASRMPAVEEATDAACWRWMAGQLGEDGADELVRRVEEATAAIAEHGKAGGA
ncbi:MAG: hypothetical protein AB7J32_14225 [Pseudonocardia sp.]